MLHSDYLKFGFKLLDKTAKVFGDNGVVSNDNSFLIHIGKGANDDKIYATYYNGIKPAFPADQFAGQYKKGEEISVKLTIDNNARVTFDVNNKRVYETTVNDGLRERLCLMAWGCMSSG